MTLVKICGLKDPVTASVAAAAGADLMGFVFVQGVRRQLTPDGGAAVISRYREGRRCPGPGLVGLFANQPESFVNEVARTCRLDFVQLCGDEGPDYWQRMDTAVIRQIKVRVNEPGMDDVTGRLLEDVDRVHSAGHRPLLDAYEPGQLGGTGMTFDWSIARAIAASREVILAGGLTPDNVGTAIELVTPWAVDVSSGVETDGEKDHSKIRAFLEAARAADGALTP